MSAATVDHVVLNSWNGEPTLYLESEGAGDPTVHWMYVGHMEPFEVWIHAALAWEEADRLTESPQPVRMDLFFRDLSSRDVEIEARDKDDASTRRDMKTFLVRGTFNDHWVHAAVGQMVQADDTDRGSRPPASLAEYALSS